MAHSIDGRASVVMKNNQFGQKGINGQITAADTRSAFGSSLITIKKKEIKSASAPRKPRSAQN
jgi:hypothetical protein